MKVSLRKASLWIGAAVVIAVFALMQPTTQSARFSYEVETISNTCTFDEFPGQDISVSGNSIIITLPIQTPTPCYEVKGTVTQSGGRLDVNLETEQVGEFCVECVGTVVGKVMISNLAKGTYDIQINSPDKSLATSRTVG